MTPSRPSKRCPIQPFKHSQSQSCLQLGRRQGWLDSRQLQQSWQFQGISWFIQLWLLNQKQSIGRVEPGKEKEGGEAGVDIMSSLIKLREIDALGSIMGSCLKATQQPLRPQHRYDPSAQKVKSDENQLWIEKRSRSYSKADVRPKARMSVDMTSSNVLARSEPFKRRVNREKDKFCGEIVTSKVTRPVFRQVLLKYKKHYHPANASRGMKDTSEERVREPRKVMLFRQSMASTEDEDFRSELRRMAVLSQVIGENNRREARQMREKSRQRRQTVM